MTGLATSAVVPLAGLSSPQANAPSAQMKDLRQVAQAFEAIFIRQVLAAARATDFGGEKALLGGPGIEQFTAMRDEHFANIASRQGLFGLAAMIERQLAMQVAPQAEEGKE